MRGKDRDELTEVLNSVSILEDKASKILFRMDEIGLQLEAINKTFICLYRQGDPTKCGIKIHSNT